MALDVRGHSSLSRRRFLMWGGVGLAELGLLATATSRLAHRGSSDSSISPSDAPAPAASPDAPSPTRPVDASAPAVGSTSVNPLPKLNYLHTDGSKLLDSSGREVVLAGVNWFGMETETLAPHGIWTRNYQEMLDQIVHLGYNCLRLPYSNELFDPALQPNGIDFSKNPDLKGLNGIQILDKIVTESGKRGLKIILDQHRPTTDSQSELWNTVELTTSEWIGAWQALAKRYLGNDTVIGADLHNEPSGPATWGAGDPTTDWPTAAEACAHAIHQINRDWLIVVEGVEKSVDQFGNVFDWTWQGGELVNARARPIKLNVANRLVYSAHDYGPSLYPQGWFSDPKFPDNLPAFWDYHWGYLHKKGIAPILIGEFGGTSVGDDAEGKWQRALLSYLKKNGMNYTYWAFNANSADTGGLLGADWSSVNQDKQNLLKTYQGELIGNRAPEVVDICAVPKPSAGRLKLKALHFDATNTQWTDVLKPELYVTNKTLEPLDLSKLELRYWFAPNGCDDPKSYSVQIGGTSTKDFGKVLSGDAVKAEIVTSSKERFGGNLLWFARITFAPGTTVPKRDAAGFGLQVKRQDGGKFFQPSHYSYRDYHWPSEWKRIGIYEDGKLVWGVEPKTHIAVEEAKKRAIDEKRAKFRGT